MNAPAECDNCGDTPDEDDELTDGVCYDCRVREIRKQRGVENP